ncbi:divergent PAP2 family protein [Bacillus coahuilensis]|uniref:divergent PAP2 family protein n=1 Tax=Bacillus coahuilensis TaxID=408580 RepID=UPI0009E9B396
MKVNKSIHVALLSILTAQLLKIPIHYVKTGKWNPNVMIQTGGMPSSHSAGVSALTTFIGLKRGISTIDFALAFVFGIIVMYDAQGVRRQTGELTLKVNNLDEFVRKTHEHEKIPFETTNTMPLKEMLGHKLEEVIGGALLGVVLGSLGHLFTKKDRRAASKRVKYR